MNKKDKYGIIAINRKILKRSVEITDVSFSTSQAGSTLEQAINEAKRHPLTYFVYAIYETEKSHPFSKYKPIGVGMPSFGFIAFISKEGIFRFKKHHSIWFVFNQIRKCCTH